MKKVKAKSKGPEKLRLINFKATAKERKAIQANAKIYTGGNVGGFIKLVAADPRLLKTNRIRVKRAA